MDIDYDGTLIKGHEIIVMIQKTDTSDGNSFSGGWRPNPGADKAIMNMTRACWLATFMSREIYLMLLANNMHLDEN
jgi:hypothetical protein